MPGDRKLTAGADNGRMTLDGLLLLRLWLCGNSHYSRKEEVIFQDIQVGADMSRTVSKAGWRKIQFCANQAVADGLEYFWVDTCCIDKKNIVELGAVINSMFRWY